MKIEKYILLLSVLIAVLAVVAAGAGVFVQGQGEPYPFQTLRGDTVMIQGRGLYAFDSVSYAAQLIGGDVVTLVLGVPLLLVSAWLTGRGSLRGKLLLVGTLGYFLYMYASIAFLAAYNPLFLLYVALFSLSVFAFVLAMISFDLKALSANFSRPLPRRSIAVYLFLMGIFLILNWVGRMILPSLTTGAAPEGLDSYATLVIQALDLGLVIPAAFLTGILVLRRHPAGHLLATVILIKVAALSAAIMAMMAGVSLAGIPISPVEYIVFPSIGIASAYLTVQVLRRVDEKTTTAVGAAAAAY